MRAKRSVFAVVVLSSALAGGCVNANKAVSIAEQAVATYEAWAGPNGVREKALDISKDVEQGLLTAQQAVTMLSPILPDSLEGNIASWLERVEKGRAKAEDVVEQVVDPAMAQLKAKAEALLADAQQAVDSQSGVDFTLRVVADALAVLFPPVAGLAGVFAASRRRANQNLRDVVVSLEAAKDKASGVIKHKEAAMPASARMAVEKILAKEGL